MLQHSQYVPECFVAISSLTLWTIYNQNVLISLNIVKLAGYNWPDRSGKPADVMAITHNNVLYDGSIGNAEDIPIKIISDPDQIYQVGTICNVNLSNDDQAHSIFLRAEIRI